jgi:hypothetical protein
MSDRGRRVTPDYVFHEIARGEGEQTIDARNEKNNLRESHVCSPPLFSKV